MRVATKIVGRIAWVLGWAIIGAAFLIVIWHALAPSITYLGWWSVTCLVPFALLAIGWYWRER